VVGDEHVERQDDGGEPVEVAVEVHRVELEDLGERVGRVRVGREAIRQRSDVAGMGQRRVATEQPLGVSRQVDGPRPAVVRAVVGQAVDDLPCRCQGRGDVVVGHRRCEGIVTRFVQGLEPDGDRLRFDRFGFDRRLSGKRMELSRRAPWRGPRYEGAPPS
jgi:hypothetical protein